MSNELREKALAEFAESGLFRLLYNSDTSRESIECAWMQGFNAALAMIDQPGMRNEDQHGTPATG